MSTAERRLRDCVGRFATGVTVVTVRTGEAVNGATVSAFTSVSLDPPLVLVSLDRRSRLCAALGGNPFGVNILTAAQRELALHFAGRSDASPMEPLWEPNGSGAPRLAGCAAFVDCAPWAAYDGGDHVLYLGRVRDVGLAAGTPEPLVHHGGTFRELLLPVRPSVWIGSLDGPVDGAWVPAASSPPLL